MPPATKRGQTKGRTKAKKVPAKKKAPKRSKQKAVARAKSAPETPPKERKTRTPAPAAQCFPSIEELMASPIPQRGNEPPRVELALDLSSSCVGWAVGVNKAPYRQGKIVFRTTAGVGEKLLAYGYLLISLLTLYKPERINIEEPLSRHGDTTRRHNELFGITRYIWRYVSEREIPKGWQIPARTVKKALNVRRGRNHDENKAIMVQKINALYGLGLKYDPRSKLETDDDIADAMALNETVWRLGDEEY